MKKIQETYIGQWRLTPLQSRHLGSSHRQFSQSPSAVLLYFPESHPWSEIFSLSKVILVLEKPRSHRAWNLGCRGAWLPRWFDVSPKNSAQDVMHEQEYCCNEAANHQLSHPNNFRRGMLKFNAKCYTDSLLYPLSHFEINSHTVHMLTQRCLLPSLASTVKLSLFRHVHSGPLSLAASLHRCCTNHSRYINNGWTFSGHNSYVGGSYNLGSGWTLEGRVGSSKRYGQEQNLKIHPH